MAHRREATPPAKRRFRHWKRRVAALILIQVNRSQIEFAAMPQAAR